MSAATPNTRSSSASGGTIVASDPRGNAITDPTDKAAYDAAPAGSWVLVSAASFAAFNAAVSASAYGANDALMAYATGIAGFNQGYVNTISDGVVGTTGRGSLSIPANNYPISMKANKANQTTAVALPGEINFQCIRNIGAGSTGHSGRVFVGALCNSLTSSTSGGTWYAVCKKQTYKTVNAEGFGIQCTGTNAVAAFRACDPTNYGGSRYFFSANNTSQGYTSAMQVQVWATTTKP